MNIIELAKKADCYREDCGFTECSFESLERFVALVLEEAAQVCAQKRDALLLHCDQAVAHELAAAIRSFKEKTDPCFCENKGKCAHPFCSCGGQHVPE